MRTVTLETIVRAIEADQTPKGRFELHDGVGGKCILGGLGDALGLNGDEVWELRDALNSFRDPDLDSLCPRSWRGIELYPTGGLGQTLTRLNDYTEMTKPQIGRLVRRLGIDLTQEVSFHANES